MPPRNDVSWSVKRNLFRLSALRRDGTSSFYNPFTTSEGREHAMGVCVEAVELGLGPTSTSKPIQLDASEYDDDFLLA